MLKFVHCLVGSELLNFISLYIGDRTRYLFTLLSFQWFSIYLFIMQHSYLFVLHNIFKL